MSKLLFNKAIFVKKYQIMANNTYKITIEPALLYGAITGGALVLHSVILYALDASFSTFAKVSGYVVPIAIIFLVLYMYRKEYRGGFMSYSQGLGMGTLIMVVAGLISAVYTFIFMKYIDPDFVKQIAQISEDAMLEKGMDEATIEQAMAFTEKFRSVGFMTIMSLVSSAIMGLVISAIVSIFLKKENTNPFAEVVEK
jgi:hypothetical protein